MGPLSTKDGKPLGPKKYKEIVREIYLITKNTNTSYSDILVMTPLERGYLLEFISDEIKKSQEYIEQRKQEMMSHKNR